MSSEDEFRERQIQFMVDQGIDVTLVHYHPVGAETVCGLRVNVYMPATDSPRTVTCPACKQYVDDYVDY
ncbi:hypothetical protein [Microbacterium sp. SA39]|uniref:hypothetical protein n=1 Tax=Microbacterium sp. SA39 TaxID=1263625 RepID=UPI0005F9C4AE|nr:hypothetical protein [Microbacterium sp. SA39]KJQ54384.1 hypothetical protein RS85_01986 [Microbacterium sp. SA39]